LLGILSQEWQFEIQRSVVSPNRQTLSAAIAKTSAAGANMMS
jgi:hypothetical protein